MWQLFIFVYSFALQEKGKRREKIQSVERKQTNKQSPVVRHSYCIEQSIKTILIHTNKIEAHICTLLSVLCMYRCTDTHSDGGNLVYTDKKKKEIVIC